MVYFNKTPHILENKGAEIVEIQIHNSLNQMSTFAVEKCISYFHFIPSQHPTSAHMEQ